MENNKQKQKWKIINKNKKQKKIEFLFNKL